jgi:ferredoxin
MEHGVRLGRDVSVDELRREHDAVVLAVGRDGGTGLEGTGVQVGRHGIEVDTRTLQAGSDGLFAAGDAVHARRMAVWAVAHGRRVALSVDAFLRGTPAEAARRPFDCRVGGLQPGEVDELMRDADEKGPRTVPRRGEPAGFSREEAVRESRRCMHCDCRKPVACRLRRYADAYGARQHRYRSGDRHGIERVAGHPRIVFEPGKCIKCGICVRIARRAGERLGLTFIGRGFDVRVGVPFNETLEKGLQIAAEACVEACPTGALAFRRDEGEKAGGGSQPKPQPERQAKTEARHAA